MTNYQLTLNKFMALLTKKEINRIKSFAWRYGAFVAIAVAGYLMNIGDIRQVDFWTLGTIFTVTTATYIFNEFTKYFNTSE